MEPKGLLVAALILGLLVLALSIDQATSDTLNHSEDAGVSKKEDTRKIAQKKLSSSMPRQRNTVA